jgi:adenylate cyclase
MGKSSVKIKTAAVKVRRSIGAKLIAIITIQSLVSLGLITALVSVMVSKDVRLTAEENNFNINRRSAAEAENSLNMIRSGTIVLLDTLNTVNSGRVEEAASLFFERNQNIAAIAVNGTGTVSRLLINNRFFLSNELDPGLAESFLQEKGGILEQAGGGEIILLNGAVAFGTPVLVMFLPWQEEAASAAVFFSADTLTENFGTGTNTTFLINGAGDILVHPDYELVRAGLNVENQEFIQTMRTSPGPSRQNLYTGEDGVRYFGAYTKLNLGGAAVITNIEYNVVFEGVTATTIRNIYLTAAVLFISVLFIYFFSKTISNPLKGLARAAGQIEAGQFKLDLKAKSRDEIGLLTESFVKMGRGLAERERLKDTFGRFTNPEIAERAMRGELALGGENKTATIFFSDIRSFTAISEKLDPGEVVEFLNDYMTRMVDCVNATGGVVDKFIGDAIMGVWGVPVSAGNSGTDALNCVKTALLMRRSLREFNRNRGGDKKPLIKIGCGINTGEVIAGQIGSEQRMEYTVIGDAVNLASRTESLNKPLKTDILITENTWQLIKDELITEEMPPVTVKGKEKPVRMFAVIGLANPADSDQGEPKTLGELRTMLELTAPNLEKVDLDMEEKKYKIGGE